MDPITLSLLFSGLGAGMDLFGTPNTTVDLSDQISLLNSDQYNQTLSQLQELLGTSQTQTDQYASQAAQNYQNMTNLGQTNYNQALQASNQGLSTLGQSAANIANIQGQIDNLGTYDPTGSTAIFESNIPLYEQLATQAQQKALDAYETPAATQALLNADAAVGTVANQFANMGAGTSGAAAAAAAQGAQSQLNELAMNRAQTGMNAYQGVYNPLLQQGQQLATQENQAAYNSQVQNLSSLLQAAQALGSVGASQSSAANQQASTAASLYGQGTSGQAGLSSLYAGLQGNALSGLTSLSQPYYYTPTYQQGSGLFGMIS